MNVLRFVGLAILLVSLAKPAFAQDAKRPGWKLTWSDEFDGDAIDREKWDYDLGNGFYNYDAEQWIHGWGNEELQTYTKDPENAFVADGSLHIRAIKESRDGFGWTSARLKTRKRDGSKLFAQTYGRFEFRAKCPTGQGVWPALWMLPQEEKHGPWAASGEIDVLEVRGHQPRKVLGTIHYGGRWPANDNAGGEFEFPEGQSVAEWHVYAVEWTPGEIAWSVDDQVYSKKNFWWSSDKTDGKQGVRPANESEIKPWPAPFDQPFYLVMNVAVGGRFPGKPNKETKFPVEMQVDHVRVYEKTGGYGKMKPRGEGKLPF